MNLTSKRGSAVSEFLVILPLILSLFYALIYLNGHLSTQQSFDLQTRNASFNLPASTEKAQNFDDSLSTDEADYEKKLDSFSKISDQRVRAAFQDSLQVSHAYELIDQLEAKNTAALLPLVNMLKNNFALGGERFFEEDQLYSNQVILQDKSWAVYGRALHLLFKDGDQHLGSLKLHSQIFHRFNDGYHLKIYDKEAVLGYGLGLFGDAQQWVSPHKKSLRRTSIGYKTIFDGHKRSFVSDCLMNFTGNSDCKFTNFLSLLQRTTYITWGLLDFVPIVNAAKQGLTQPAKAIYTEMNSTLVSGFSSSVQNGLKEKGGSYFGKQLGDTPLGGLSYISEKISPELQEKLKEPFKEVIK